MRTSEELERSINERLRAGPIKKKKVVVEPPKAEVIPLPTGQALAVAKQDRTRASEINQALERVRAAGCIKEDAK